ncbi:hypothetical protein GCM10009094_27840 [Massilia aurea]
MNANEELIENSAEVPVYHVLALSGGGYRLALLRVQQPGSVDCGPRMPRPNYELQDPGGGFAPFYSLGDEEVATKVAAISAAVDGTGCCANKCK